MDIYGEGDRSDLTALTQRCQNKLLPFPLLPMHALTHSCMHALVRARAHTHIHIHTEIRTKQIVLLIISRD